MNRFEYDEADETVFVYPEGHKDIVAVFYGITAIEQDAFTPNRWRLNTNLRRIGTLWDCKREEEG